MINDNISMSPKEAKPKKEVYKPLPFEEEVFNSNKNFNYNTLVKDLNLVLKLATITAFVKYLEDTYKNETNITKEQLRNSIKVYLELTDEKAGKNFKSRIVRKIDNLFICPIVKLCDRRQTKNNIPPTRPKSSTKPALKTKPDPTDKTFRTANIEDI